MTSSSNLVHVTTLTFVVHSMLFKEVIVGFICHLLILLNKRSKKLNHRVQLDAVSREEQVRNNSLSIGFQVKVGCCTVDILKQISGEEISRTAADGKPIDRLSRLANHILNQQRYYCYLVISVLCIGFRNDHKQLMSFKF